jgi:hypothetical protein
VKKLLKKLRKTGYSKEDTDKLFVLLTELSWVSGKPIEKLLSSFVKLRVSISE